MATKFSTYIFVILSALASAPAFADQPVYIIAHRCNDPEDVSDVLAAQGVNAIEADFSYGSPTEFVEDRWAVDHDGVFPTSTGLDEWLDATAGAINAPGSTLSLIVVDIKDPESPLPELYTALRAGLGPDINLIFSIADFPSRESFDPLINLLNADPRAGADMAYLDEGNDETQFMVRDYFEQIGMKRYWYGDGFAAPFVTPDSVVTNIDDGMMLRDQAGACESFHGVYTWTYEKQSSIKEFLDKGVNGILINTSECGTILGQSGIWEAKDAVAYIKNNNVPGRVFATPSDNAFANMDVPAELQCMEPTADLEISRSHFFLNYTAGRITSTIEMPVPVSTAFNTAETPFVLPCNVQLFGGQLNVHLAGATEPMNWACTARFVHEEGFVITGHGYANTESFDHVTLSVGAPLAKGASVDIGYTPISSISPFRNWLYQPGDLPANTPVRMELEVTPYLDAGLTQEVGDPSPENNFASVYVMRSCP